MESLSNYLKPYRDYEGKTVEDLKHIPEVSVYNMNYYVGLKRRNLACNDLIYILTDEAYDIDYWYILDGNEFKFFGYTENDDGLVLTETMPS